MRLPGVRMTPASAVITAKVEPEYAVALREAARANCRTVSGELRAMLIERFSRDGVNRLTEAD